MKSLIPTIKRMNVGIYFPDLKPSAGGGFTFEDNILQALLTCQTHHNFFIFWHGKTSKVPNSNISFIHIGKPKGLQKLKRETLRLLHQCKLISTKPGRFAETLKQHSIDIVWFPSPAFQDTGGIPYMFTVWDLSHRIHPYFPELSYTWDAREAIYSKVIPKASYLITGNEVGKEDIAYFYRVLPERIKVVPIPISKFPSVTPIPLTTLQKEYAFRSPYLYCPAMLWPHKNHYRILEALKILKENYNEVFHLVLTGRDTGNFSYLKEKIKGMGLGHQVSFFGFVDTATKVALYQNAHATICATYIGPSSLPPFEAFSLQCPVICSRYRGAECELKDNALYFNLDNPRELAECILTLYNKPNFKASLVKKALAFFEAHSATNYVDPILTILDEFQAMRNCWGKDYQEQ